MPLDRDNNVADKQQEVQESTRAFITLMSQLVKQTPAIKEAFDHAPSAIKANRNYMRIIIDDMLNSFVDIMAHTIKNSSAEFEDLPHEFYVRLYRDRHGTGIKKSEAIENLREAIEERNLSAFANTQVTPDFFRIMKDAIHPGILGNVAQTWGAVVSGYAELMMQGQALAAANASGSQITPMMLEIQKIQQEAMQSGKLASMFAGAAGEPESENVAQWIDEPKTRFSDVAGVEESKEQVTEVIDFLKNAAKYEKLGAKMPTGILMEGPPGTGKTLLASAVAGEAGVPFCVVSGSEFVEKYVGVGAARVRELFKEAREKAPCIIFIDEIDAVGKTRDGGGGGGNDERDQTLNQILVEMNGLGKKDGVIVMAATNRPEILDPALKRPGRFDRTVSVPLPDSNGRTKILEVHTKNKPLAAGVDLKKIGLGTPGFSGAELANLANEAAILAAKNGQEEITEIDFKNARDNVTMGRQQRSRILVQEEIENTAYHEVGHALINLLLEPWTNRFERVTIVPRGGALGVSMSTPKEGRASQTLIELLARMRLTAGGRAAEELKFGPAGVTGGASSDIDHNSSLARQMVMNLGFSKKLGAVRYSNRLGDIFSGAGAGGQTAISPETQTIIDQEIRDLVEAATDDAYKILEHNKDVFEEWSQLLIEKETVEREDVLELFGDRLEIPPGLAILSGDGYEIDPATKEITTTRGQTPAGGAPKAKVQP